jgi:glycosyltransferase involved in cell wall biosynthesis
MTDTPAGALATVVVPAHDEGRVIGRLLEALVQPDGPRLHVVVVANGCTDRTADIARSSPGVQVLELEEGNKQLAMRAGALRAGAHPVVFVDADVVVSADAVLALVIALAEEGVEAAAPRRVLDLDRSSVLVRSYYALWSALPQVTNGLFGRGVIALSVAGRDRVANLPLYLSDDLALSESFSSDERRVVDGAVVVVVGPRGVGDLLRRRQRIVMGNREFDETSPGRQRTGLRTLVDVVRRRPALAVHVPTFLAVTVASRVALRLRRADGPVWLRDDSSREG